MDRFAQDADTDRLLTGLSQQHAEVSRFIRDLIGPISDLKKVEIARQELAKRIQPFGDIINRVITTFKPKVAGMPHADLIALADDLDRCGLFDAADVVDGIIDGTATPGEFADVTDCLDESGLHNLANMMDGISASLVKCGTYIPKMRDSQPTGPAEPIQPPHEGNLSTRYCPDHVGVQAARIAEYIYQCPLDGKIYNYQMGYVNYQGQRVLGGSVAEQTPPTSDYGGIPMRVYDSRQNVLNSIY